MNRTRTIAAALLVAAGSAFAQAPEIDSALNESVQVVHKPGVFAIGLETTVYMPEGDGPFPVVVINHGKANGDPRFQARYRPAQPARYFLQRGYAVVVPMRQGFSKSGGSYIGGGCNVESNGRVQAEDVKAVLDFVAAQPWADRQRLLVVGQSHGGWTTLAFGAQNYPGVKGLVNFAGGLRQDGCPNWKEALAGGAASYARGTQLPSLWFYGDNDSYFDPPTWRAMFEQYTAAGGKAKLVAFGRFGADSHSLFGSPAGGAIWQPEMTAFLASIGMPSQPQAAYAKFGVRSGMPVPRATDFAALDDETKVPHVRDTGRAGSGDYDLDVGHVAFGEAKRVVERGEDHDGRAVLVVVEDRDVEALDELAFDLEAARRGDVLEVDAAEGRREAHDRLDDLGDILGRQRDRDRVDSAELLEQDGLALHDGHRGGGADVTQAQNGGAIGDHGDSVGDPGVFVGGFGIGGNRLAHLGDARCVGHREVLCVAQRNGRRNLHLAAAVQREDGVFGIRRVHVNLVVCRNHW